MLLAIDAITACQRSHAIASFIVERFRNLYSGFIYRKVNRRLFCHALMRPGIARKFGEILKVCIFIGDSITATSLSPA